MSSPVGYVFLAFILAIVGGVLGTSLARSHKRLCALISLGAGTLLGVTVFAIVPEGARSLEWWGVLVALASGYFLFLIITKYVYHVCPACAASHFDEATRHRFSEFAAAMMIALAIHCTADGLALAAGHEAHASHVKGGQALDYSLVLAVCVHKIPEGLALGALLLGAGFRQIKTVSLVAGVEATTLLGGILGAFVVHNISFAWLGAILTHVGGGFLYLAAHALRGEIFEHHKSLVLTNFTAGFAAIGVLTLVLHLL
jgi:zinc transporter ZupT